MDKASDANNLTRICDKIFTTNKEVSRGDFKRSESKSDYGTPQKPFCEMHNTHPNVRDPLQAMEADDVPTRKKLKEQLSRTGRRSYAESRGSSGAEALFSYLARAGCGKR